MIHPALIVLRSLLNGITVKLDNYEYVLDQTKEVSVPTVGSDVYTNDKICLSDMTLGEFIRLCESQSEDRILMIAANTAGYMYTKSTKQE